MQPIVAKYDADRWYSEVVAFVLFGTGAFCITINRDTKSRKGTLAHRGDVADATALGAESSQANSYCKSPQHPTKQEVQYVRQSIN